MEKAGKLPLSSTPQEFNDRLPVDKPGRNKGNKTAKQDKPTGKHQFGLGERC